MQAQGQLEQLKKQFYEVDGDGKERLDLLVDLVKQCYYFEHPDSSLKYANLAMTLAERKGELHWRAKALYSQGLALFAAQKPDRSLEALQQAESAVLAIPDTTLLLDILNLLGNNFFDLGLMELAMEKYLRAIAIAEALGDPAKATAAYANIGRISSTKESYSEAKKYYRYSSELYLQQGDTLRSLAILLNLVSTYLRLNRPDSAQYLADWGWRKSQQLKYPAGVFMANVRRSQVAITLGNFEHALAITQFMLDSLPPDDYRIRYNAWHYRGMALDSLGQFDAALEAAQKANEFAVLTESQPVLASTYHRLYEAHKNVGNPEEALAYYEIYRTVGDSILDGGMARKLTTMQHLYETERQSSEIQALQNRVELERLKLRQWGFLGISLLLLLALIASIVVYRKQQKAQREQQERQLAEQRLLSLQMNPHFLFNSLTSLQRYLLEQEDTRTAQTYLGKLATLMRNILEQSRERLIPLAEELESLELYLSVQKLRWKDRLKYKIELTPELSDIDIWIPPLLVQPLVENAIEHSGITEKEEGLLEIRVEENEHNVRIMVNDNGKGWTEKVPGNRPGRKGGLALGIVQDRLKLLSQLRQQPHKMDIHTHTQTGTHITLILPNYESANY